MKSLYVFLTASLCFVLLLFSSINLFAQDIVQFADEDLKKKMASFDTDKDGEIQIEEALAVEGKLQVNSCHGYDDITITDLGGLEAFQNVTELEIYCFDRITTFDLALFPNLLGLTISGDKFEEIENLAGNTKLEKLSIQDGNFSKLDISGCTALKELALSRTNIETLDLSTNVALERLWMRDNLISSLDLRNNLNLNEVDVLRNPLTCILVDDPAVAETWSGQRDDDDKILADCDIIYFPDEKFKEYIANIDGINADINGDGEIQISEAEAITGVFSFDNGNESNIASEIRDITGITYFTNITEISGSPAFLENVDISGMTNVEIVNFTNGTVFNFSAEGCTNLTEVTLNTVSIKKINLNGCSSLTSLNAEYNGIPVEGRFNMLNSISLDGCTSLTSINVEYNTLTELDLTGLPALKSLIASPSLTLTCVQVDDPMNVDSWDIFSIPNTSTVSDNCANSWPVNIPDTEFLNLLLSKTNLNTVDDGIISYAEAEAFTSPLQITNSDIQDLTGLEAFVNISSLYISLVQGTGELDLSNLKNLEILKILNNSYDSINLEGLVNLQNVSIEELSYLKAININEATALTQLQIKACDSLTELDVSTCTNLETLKVNGALTELNLQNNYNLQYLDCSNNNIADLDVSNNTALTSIFCSSTGLISINLQNIDLNNASDLLLTGNPNLQCVLVDNAIIAGSRFSPKNPGVSFYEDCSNSLIVYIPDENFKNHLLYRMHLDTNGDGEIQYTEAAQVSEISWSEAYKFADLTGIQAFCNLKKFTWTGTPANLKELNLSNMPSLKKVVLNYYSQNRINLSNCTNLDSLSLAYCSGGEILLDISGCSSLSTLSLRYNEIFKLDVSGLSSLEKIDASSSGIKDIVFDENNTSLNTLVCSNNNLSRIDISQLSSLAKFDATSNPNLSCIQVADIDEAEANPNWSIDATANYSTDCDEEWLVYIPDEAFKTFLVENTDINTNGDEEIQYTEAEAYSGALELNVNQNADFESISDLRGIEAFTQISEITINGLEYLTDLKIVTQNLLEKLTVYYTESLESITINGLASIKTIDVYANSSLQAVNISNCESLIYFSCSTNPKLSSVYLDNIPALESLGIYSSAISSIDVSPFTQLNNLDVSNNLLESIDVSSNSYLKKLDVQNNAIMELDVSHNPALQELFCSNNALTSLNLKTGYPETLTLLYASDNPQLFCVSVDDVEYAYSTYSQPNPNVIFFADCNETVEIPDDAFRSYLVDVSDINADKLIQVYEAEVYTEQIYLPYEMKNATGISAFKNITSLSAGMSQTNQFELNVSGMEKLESISLSRNSSINAIDITGCSALSKITSNMSILEEIKVADKNTALKNLSITSSQRELVANLSAMQGLESLSLSGILTVDASTMATNLDLINNTNLQSITLTNTGFTEVDLSQSPVQSIVSKGNSQLYCIQVADVNLTVESNTDNYVVTTDCSLEQEIVFEDIDLKNLLISNSNIDTHDDDRITYSEAYAFTETLTLDCSDITSLAGLEHFKNITGVNIANCQTNSFDAYIYSNLETLEVFNVAFQNIDVHELANLKTILVQQADNLTGITLDGCESLTDLEIEGCDAIANIDISTNTALENMSISGDENATFSSIDFQNNLALKSLNLNSFHITELDLSANTALTSIQINAPSLTVFDASNITMENITSFVVSNSPDITCIQVDSPEYANENFTDIPEGTTFSDNCFSLDAVPFEDPDLEALLLANEAINTEKDTKITFEEASAFTGALEILGEDITSLSGIEYFENISNVSISDIQLQALDFSDRNIESFSLSNSSIKSVNLENCLNLTELTLENAGTEELNIDKCVGLLSITITGGNLVTLDVIRLPLLQNLTISSSTISCVQVYNETDANEMWRTTVDENIIFSTDCNGYNKIVFADEDLEALLLADPSVNTNTDGYISAEEATTFQGNLAITGETITDLGGIEAFENCTSLTISDVQVPSTFDASNFTAIESITIENALFETINANGLENLSALTLQDAGNISSLEITGSNNIETLVFTSTYNTTLNSIDLSEYTSLTSLELSVPNVTELDLRTIPFENVATLNLSGSTNLTCVHVDNPELAYEKFADANPDIRFKIDCNIPDVISIPDPAFKNYVVTDLAIDTNEDGEIEPEEAEAFSGAFSIDNASIASLEGIQYFSGLTNLTVSNGNENLTSIDLSGLSNLKTFEVYNSSIEIINLELCTALTNVVLNNAGVSTINLNKCVYISDIAITGGNLETLDVSKLPLLENLSVSSSTITCIKVSDENDAEAAWRATVDEGIALSEDCKTALPPVINEIDETACDFYTFKGVQLQDSGVYRDTLQAKSGADSIVILHLTINNSVTNTKEVTIFDGESYRFGALLLTENGNYEQTFTTKNGCDSIVKLSLNVKFHTVVFNIVSITSYGEYEFGGETLTVSGNYKDTLTSVSGDDSVVILKLTIYPTKIVNREDVIYKNETYNFYGQELSQAGTYKASFPAGSGRDSIVKLTLSVIPQEKIVSVTNATACGEYSFNGRTITQTGTYRDTIKTAENNDSIAILNVTVNSIDHTSKEAIISEGETYEFANVIFSESGKYEETLTNKNGCDSIVTLNLTVIEKTEITNEIIVSACGEYPFGDTILTSSGQYMHTYKTKNNKDSIVILNLTILEQYNTVTEDYVFYGNTVTFGDKILNKTGIYTQNLKAKYGCDSTVTLKLNVIPLKVVYDIEIAEVCNSFSFNDQDLTESGVYYDTISANGIDTVKILKLSVGNPYNVTREEFIKPGEEFAFGNTIYTEPGTYTETFESQRGCDSTVTVILSMLDEQTILERDTVVTCEEYSFNGETLTQSGTYKAIHKTATGYDSIVLLDLTVHSTYDLTFDTEIKDGESIEFGGDELKSDGVFTKKFTTIYGCDSIVTLNLAVNRKVPKYQEFFYTDCGAFKFNDTYIYEDGIYVDTFKTIYGADSIVKIHLTINQESEVDVEDYFTEGTEYVFGTQTLTQAGNYREVFESTNGCDSTVYLTLYGVPVGGTVIEIVDTTCGGYDFYGDILYESGRYIYTIKSESGTNDTIVHLKLTMVNGYATSIDEYIHEGESYILGPNEIKETGEYSHTFITSKGCDSTVTLTLTVLPKGTIVSKIYRQACEEFYFADELLTQSGKYSYSNKTAEGLDSLTVLYLTVNSEYHEVITDTIMEGDIFSYNGKNYTTTGEYVISGTTASGCDSTIVISLMVLAPNDTLTIEECEKYEFYGKVLTESGTYTHNIETESGAKSTVVLHLKIHKTYLVELDTIISKGDVIVFGDEELNQEGSATKTFASEFGCDSIVTMNITFDSEADTIVYIEACESFEYNNEVLTESKHYFYTFKDKNQKDSIVELDVTIHKSYNKIVNDTIVYGTSISIGDNIFTEEGEHFVTLESEYGCDSIIQLLLTITNTAPSFILDRDVIEIELYENTENGETVQELKAKDAENNTLSFALLGQSSVFAINSETGEIYIKDNSNLDYEKYRSFTLEAVVSDGLASDTIKVIVHIQDRFDGISEGSKLSEKIRIYPTFAESYVTIDSEISEGTIYILSTSGVELQRINLSENVQISIKELPKGSYLIKVETRQGTQIEKIIKE